MIGLVEKQIHIDAPRTRVFELFTTTDGLQSWMAAEAEVDLRPGGAWRWVHDNGHAVGGHYLLVDPPERLAFTYGWETGPFAAMAPGSTKVDVTFDDVDGGTVVSISHSAVPTDFVDRHLAGWTHFLGLLADVAADGAAAPRQTDTGD